ncbi:hypothetical protein Slin15195_G081630 [Septoria linicola]|uniref:Uncharacterized protein n=1 Tax=Septoria linicola TaxID=215465 RepID=A0A9Q9ASY4_9PEZI|nr:hypothetical protein Slin15195_G081630 [Septoria linicola]
MSKSLHSPTARLLQSSRLFSLPRPLPQPALESASASGAYRASETATLPYPTHQAIATPASSHFRGDWGLKRPIPRKTTARSTTPVIRVRAQDNTQHITDFESAADHVLTESKWRQMGIPLMNKEPRTTYSGDRASPQSVYDDNLDITDPEAAQRDAPQMTAARTRGAPASVERTNQRWKFEGPWIPGMQEGEFDEYISGKLTKRKAEFRHFLTKRILEKRIHDEERSNRDRGQSRAVSTSRIEELRKEVEENYESEEKKLRDDHVVQNLGSELTAAICDFLDLPGVRMGRQNYAQSSLLQAQVSSLTSDSGPPSTHPGAGLSHLRTNAFMENHPYWGPQAHRAPVKARVLRPRNSSLYTEFQAKIGVGGVVTSDPIGSSNHSSSRGQLPEYTEEHKDEHYLDNDRMTSALDENLPGGNKIWVQPDTAHINESGNIQLHISRGDKEAIAVKRNKVEHIHQARSQSYGGPTGPGYVGTAKPGQEANYGYSLPGMRQQRQRSSGVKGFDEELGRSPRQGQMEQGEAAQKIRELMAGAGKGRGGFSRR